MLGQAGQALDQRVDKGRAELAGRPRFQMSKVQLQADDREVRIM